MLTWMRIIAVLEVVGGACGIAGVAWGTASRLGAVFTDERVGPVGFSTLMYAAAAVGVYSLSLIAGVALLRGRRSGRALSFAVQAIQLPKFHLPPLAYGFSFGLDLFVEYARTRGPYGFSVSYAFPSAHELSVSEGGGVVSLGVSLTAWLFLTCLFRVRRLERMEKDVTEPVAAEC